MPPAKQQPSVRVVPDPRATWPRYDAEPATSEHKVGFFLAGHPFPCLDFPPAGAWRDLASPMWPQARVIEYIETCIASEEDLELFRQIIVSRENLIPIETLGKIVNDLIEVYQDRPTSPSTGSPNGVSPTAIGSMDGASSQG